MVLLRKKDLFHALNEDPTESESTTVAAVNKFCRADEKACPHIVLNLGEEQASLITSLLL